MPDPSTAAPMAAAPMLYDQQGRPDWANMWTTFCVLPHVGGPPHRAPEDRLVGDPASLGEPGYHEAEREIARAVEMLSGFTTRCLPPGYVGVLCESEGMARWLAAAINRENVAASRVGRWLNLPVAAHFQTEKEVKSVVTVFAKTTDYWLNHMTAEQRAAQDRLTVYAPAGGPNGA